MFSKSSSALYIFFPHSRETNHCYNHKHRKTKRLEQELWEQKNKIPTGLPAKHSNPFHPT